jgi:hypothetical protein
MSHCRFLSSSDLTKFDGGDGSNLADLSHGLLNQQKETWPMLRKGYDALSTLRTRQFPIDGTHVVVQFNPGRIASSTAIVDDATIRARKCFLCIDHLPPEQRGLMFEHDFVVLCNPFPIFPEHFTIARIQHTPQRILANFPAMLDLAKALRSRYSIFYNGPKCGASAPDHMHFQGYTRGWLPVEKNYASMIAAHGKTLIDGPLKLTALSSSILRILSLESSNPEVLVHGFEHIYRSLGQFVPTDPEPMLNVLTSHDGNAWRVLVFPRLKHRPSFYFAEGDERILLSPATVELGGECSVPLEHDFNKLNVNHLLQMYQEVLIDPETLEELGQQLV